MRTIRQSLSKIFLSLFQASKNNSLTHLSREIAFQWSSVRQCSDHSLLKCFFTTTRKKEQSWKPPVSLRFNPTCYRAETFLKGRAEVSWVKSTLICSKETYCHLQWIIQLGYPEPRRSNKIRDMGKETHSYWFCGLGFFLSLHRWRCYKHIARSLMTASTKNKQIWKGKIYTFKLLLLFWVALL